VYVTTDTDLYETVQGNRGELTNLSDVHGVWFPNVKRRWYEKSPDSVSDEEFDALVRDFDAKLRSYKKIYFYHHPARFHRLYRRLLDATMLKAKVGLIKNVSVIQ
jgi:hypothetical protein